MSYEITCGMVDKFRVESIEAQTGMLGSDKMDFEIVLFHPESRIEVSSFVTVTVNNNLITRVVCNTGYTLSSFARKEMRIICSAIIDGILERYNGINHCTH